MMHSFLRPRSTAVRPREMKNPFLFERVHFSKGVFFIVYESSFDVTQSSLGHRGGAFRGVRGNDGGLCLRHGRFSKAISGTDCSIEVVALPPANNNKEEG